MKAINRSFSILALFFFGITMASMSVAGDTSSFTGVSYGTNYANPAGYQTAYQTYYTSDQINTYWPVIANQTTCQSRQDLILQIAPGGCQPAVVRSDLLADQNVPVFCQIDALKLNPLIDISQINSIRFTQQYPKEIAGIGYHPANAALRTTNALLGSPVLNNIGYVVVILKQNANESSLPSLVNISLTGYVTYDAGNALGIGSADFILSPMSDDKWGSSVNRDSFWQGRYYIRLENADPNYATISIYQGDNKISTIKAPVGKTSDKIYLPGFYCRASLQVQYTGFVQAQNKARLEIDGDTIDVYSGSRILNGQCTVTNINIGNFQAGQQVIYNGQTATILSVNTGSSTYNLKTSDGKNPANVKLSDLTSDAGSFGSVTLNCGSLFSSGSITLYRKPLSNLQASGFAEGDLVTYGGGKAKILTDNKDGTYNILKSDSLLGDYIILAENVPSSQLILPPSSQKALQDKIQASADAEKAINDAIKSYEDVADQYPRESSNPSIASDAVPAYGETALKAAIDLADKYGKSATEADLINKFIKLYPSSLMVSGYNKRLQQLYFIDSSLAGSVVYLNNKYVSVKLVDLEAPIKKSGANFTIGNSHSATSIGLKEQYSLPQIATNNNNKVSAGTISLYSLTASQAIVSATCAQNIIVNGNVQSGTSAQRFTFSLDQRGQTSQEICGIPVVLDAIDMQQLASIRLIPSAENAQSEVNLSVGIGIEKRAIQLSPEKTREMIANINQSIEKWEGISNTLGNVVTGMKAACFATSAALTIKSFITGINGAGIARQSIMAGTDGWNVKCQQMVASNQYKTINECFTANSGQIESEVSIRTNAINSVNNALGNIPNCKSQSTNALSALFGSASTVNREKCAESYYQYIISNYGTNQIALADGSTVTVSKMLELRQGEGYQNGTYTLDQLKNIQLNIQSMQAGGASDTLKSNSLSTLRIVYNQIQDNKKLYDDILSAQNDKSRGWAGATVVGANGAQTTYMDVQPLPAPGTDGITFNSDTKKTTTIILPNAISDLKSNTYIPAGTYRVGLKPIEGKQNNYIISDLHKVGGDTADNPYKQGEKVIVSDSSFVQKFGGALNIKDIVPQSQISYHNKYLNPQVQYFETEPYKGMPAIVPFDTTNGWYAATKQTLPAFGAQGTFDASGRVSSFWLCNVGLNGINQFNEGIGDDICEMVNLNNGQPLNQFPNLNTQQASALVTKAVQALNDAANQYRKGQGAVSVNGETLQRGAPAVNLPTLQCTNFMSASDCNILFNVCDPVICPSSRCNLGGAYPVSNVVQTGIIGSLVLCLPNFGLPSNGGVAIPVCLSGLNAGIQNYVSVLKAGRDCLQNSLNTGSLVGICDEVTSIYTCEFFWRQVAPFANLLLPKIIELAYTGGQARGGGEYMTVMGAWQNTQNAIDYFTNQYAVNSLTAFNMRNIETAGTTFCKAFISASAPSSIKSLIQPDSPPQFSAWFSSTPFTTATVPATSQYKVYYHIFGGNDAGTYYSVYLKSNPTTSYYYISPIVTVASGFVAKGDYADQTRDFTAPTGYQQLCVSINGEEQCGFGQVSTSFAVNQLSDYYAASEINQISIHSEKECISGSANAGALLTTPNLQAGAESAAFPAIYNKGITRICATQNPGSTTNPTRYVNVGNCGDLKIICWLDKNSVENAISESNLGLQNQTLSDLQNLQQQAILAQGGLSSDQASVILNTIDSETSMIEKNVNSKADVAAIQTSVTNELVKIDTNFGANLENLFLNTQKAQTLFLKARLKAALAQSYFNTKQPDVAQTANAITGSGNESSASSSFSGDINAETATNNAPLTTNAALDSSKYDPIVITYILINNKQTQIYLQDNKVKYDINLWYDATIGSVSNRQIKLLPAATSHITSDEFNILNNAQIEADRNDGLPLVLSKQ